MTARVGDPGAPRISSAPAASAMRSALQLRTEYLLGDGCVVERDLLPVREFLALLVTLARDDHHITGTGLGDCTLDRGATIHNLLEPGSAHCALDDVGDDRIRILTARVVRCHDRDV